MAWGLSRKPRPDADKKVASRGGGGLSLKGRALKFLSQREHSRVELARKLSRFEEDSAVIESLLDELVKGEFLSDERFVVSLIHRKSARFGSRRIGQELSQHRIGGEVSSSALADLKASDLERAKAVWQRRFDELPVDVKQRAQQYRFLAQRGFGHEIISEVFQWAASDKL